MKFEVTVSFNSKEEADLFKASCVGAGIGGEVSSPLKQTISELYKKQTGTDLPEGEVFLDPTYADQRLKNMFVAKNGFVKNIG